MLSFADPDLTADLQMPPCVDVVMPVRNGELYVGQSIQSALDQTYRKLSVLVVDDGSTDNTAKIVRSFGPLVRCISTEPRGLSAARNRSLDETTGELIAFLDGDDLWHPGKISKQVEFLIKNPECGLVHTQERRIDEHGLVIRHPEDEADVEKPKGWCFEQLIRVNTVVVSSVMMRRTALGSLRFDPTLYGAQDYDLWLKLAQAAPFGFIEEALTDYRMHSNAMSLVNEKMTADCILIMERIIQSATDENIRGLARDRRRGFMVGRALRAYAAGEHGKAIRLFRECDFPLSWKERFRFFASHIPETLVRRIRGASRSLRAGWR